jgi:hypothetical protein
MIEARPPERRANADSGSRKKPRVGAPAANAVERKLIALFAADPGDGLAVIVVMAD